MSFNIKLLLYSQKLCFALKARDQAVKSKDNLMRDLNRKSQDVNHEKELLQQECQEIKVCVPSVNWRLHDMKYMPSYPYEVSLKFTY